MLWPTSITAPPSTWPPSDWLAARQRATRSDYELVVLPFYDDSPDFVGDALADFDHCAAVYVATE